MVGRVFYHILVTFTRFKTAYALSNYKWRLLALENISCYNVRQKKQYRK